MTSTALLAINLLLVLAPRSGAHDPQQISRSTCGSFGFNEFVIDTGMAYIRTDQNRPTAVFNGDEYLIAWYDGRGYNPTGDIRAARISATGTILDPHGFPVCMEAHGQRSPALACVGSTALAVWHDLRGDNAGDIYCARIADDGAVLEPDGVVICDAAGGQQYPTVAGGDTSWLVVWQDARRDSWSVYGARVGGSGQVIDPGGFVIAAGTGSRQLPAVSYDGTDFLVVWQTNEYGPLMVWGARVSPTGQILEPGGFPIGGDMSQGMTAVEASIATNGQQFLVTWQNNYGSHSIYCRTVSGDGGTLGPVRCLSPDIAGYRPTAAWDGTQYEVLWDDAASSYSGDILGARVDSAGSPKGPYYTVSSEQGTQAFTGIAGGALQSLAVWESDPYDEELSQLRVTRLDTTGAVLDSAQSAPWGARVYGYQMTPSIAVLDSQYLLTWASRDPLSDSAFGYDICGTRLDRDGRMLDSMAIPISVCAAGQWAPAVAAGDSSYFVAWSDGRWYWPNPKLYGTVVTKSGTVLSPEGTIISNGPSIACTHPAVAFDGANYLVAWAESKNIYGARVSQSGPVLDRINISLESTNELAPSAAFDGTNYLVVWQNGDRAWGTRITPAGVVLDPGGFAISPPGYFGRSLATTFGGTDYFVVWHDENSQIKGARVSPAGTVLDAVPIALSDWEGYYRYDGYPSVNSNGSNYIVSWLTEDHYSNLILEINGAVVSPLGARIDTFHVSVRGCRDQGPACVTGTDGRTLVVYPSVLDPNGGGRDTMPRIWGSFVSPSGAVAEHDNDISESGRPPFSVGPSPFSRMTCLRFGRELLDADARVTICDAAGRYVRELNAHGQAAVNWDGTDSRGLSLPRGIYFCRLTAGEVKARLKLVKLD